MNKESLEAPGSHLGSPRSYAFPSPNSFFADSAGNLTPSLTYWVPRQNAGCNIWAIFTLRNDLLIT